MIDLTSYEMPLLDGSSQPLSAFKGKVVLIVNTASQCGFTPQYQGLESLYKEYKEQGFVVLGFPCNQFGKQEPGESSEIGLFCEKNFGVTFPVFEKIEVNGEGTAPLYKDLKDQASGILGTKSIKWNFSKFLIGKDGVIIGRYAPTTKPEALEQAIRVALKS